MTDDHEIRPVPVDGEQQFVFEPNPYLAADPAVEVWEQIKRDGAFVYDSAGNLIGHAAPAVEVTPGVFVAQFECMPPDPEADADG